MKFEINIAIILYLRSDRIENTRDIPQEGKTYIFMAFGQPDGELILEAVSFLKVIHLAYSALEDYE